MTEVEETLALEDGDGSFEAGVLRVMADGYVRRGWGEK